MIAPARSCSGLSTFNCQLSTSRSPKSFPCHTSEESARKSNHCHTSKIALPQALCLPHIRAPPGGWRSLSAGPLSQSGARRCGIDRCAGTLLILQTFNLQLSTFDIFALQAGGGGQDLEGSAERKCILFTVQLRDGCATDCAGY